MPTPGGVARGGGPDGPGVVRGRDLLGPRRARVRRPAVPPCSSSAWRPRRTAANRTGRMFTGDRSGDWLFAALYRAGFANQPTSMALDDGLALRDAYITAAVHCAPPANKPRPAERDACAPYLTRELALLRRAVVIVALGQFAWQARGGPLRAPPAARVRPSGRGDASGRPHAARLVPSEPAEHVHRQTDRAHVRRRVQPGAPGAGAAATGRLRRRARSAEGAPGGRLPSRPHRGGQVSEQDDVRRARRRRSSTGTRRPTCRRRFRRGRLHRRLQRRGGRGRRSW